MPAAFATLLRCRRRCAPDAERRRASMMRPIFFRRAAIREMRIRAMRYDCLLRGDMMLRARDAATIIDAFADRHV